MNDKTKLKELEKNLCRAKFNVNKILIELDSYKDEQRKELFEKEGNVLIERFKKVIKVLAVCIIAGFIGIGILIYLDIDDYWICGAAGFLGSSIAAIRSALDRRANGFEFKNGIKYPRDEPKSKFSLSMANYFMLRPLLGLFAGIIIYFGIDRFMKSEPTQINIENTIFWSLLAGLFAKTLIDKLLDIFKSVFGK